VDVVRHRVRWPGHVLRPGGRLREGAELGTFSLQELRENRGQLGLEIERDFYFTPCPLSTLLPWWRERLEKNAA